MTVLDIASQLMTHFSPEERSIPDADDYQGRNAAVMGAINGALQEVFSEGSPWVRFAERGVLLYAPVEIPIVVTHGSTEATIAAASWLDWFAGCTIQVNGAGIQNRIVSGSEDVVLKFPHDGDSCPMATETVTLAGTLTSDGTTPVTVPAMTYAGLEAGYSIWSSDGTTNVDPTGEWASFAIAPDGTAQIVKYVDNVGVFIADTAVAITAPDDTAAVWVVTSPATWTSPVVNVARTYTPTTATVYHTSIDLPSDVLEVHGPVKIDGLEVSPENGTVDNTVYERDFGFVRLRAVGDTGVRYRVEAWDPGSDSAPGFRLALSHYPTAAGFLEYRAMICPLVVDDLLSTATLPIPFQWIDSVFYPICRKRLSGCDFFRSGSTAQEIQDSYQMAIKALKSLNPRKRSGITMLPIH